MQMAGVAFIMREMRERNSEMLPEVKQEEIVQGEKPEVKVTETVAPTVEELQKKLDEAARHAKNKEEEAARVQKKVEAFEKAEKERAEAQLSKEELAEKQRADEKVKADQAVADADKKVAEADKKVAEADAKLLKAAFLLKAKDLGFEHPADAFALADKNVTKKDDGEYDEASIEAALKPLIGRLPVKAQGDGKGTPKLPPAPASKTKQKEGRAFGRPF